MSGEHQGVRGPESLVIQRAANFSIDCPMAILHIGTHKTGTTCLQNFFALNRKFLLEQGIYYPDDINGGTGHHTLPLMIRKNQLALAKKYVAERFELARRFGSHAILFSSEEFESIDHLSLVREIFPENTRIIVYLRRPDDYLESKYKQHVRTYSLRFSRDIYQFWVYHDLSDQFDYRILLNRWSKTFGESNIFVMNYEKEKETGLIKGMLSFLNCSDDNLIDVPQTQMNVSPSSHAILYLARFNREIMDAQLHHSIMRELMVRFPMNNNTLIDREMRSRILKRFSKNNRLVFKKYLRSENAYAQSIAQNETRKTVDFYDDFDSRLMESVRRAIRPRSFFFDLSHLLTPFLRRG